MLDVLIRGGLLIDGTGAPARRADVGVVGDRIVAVGDLAGAQASREIEATGLIVCPGFIDVHVHAEIALVFGEDRFVAACQGITTVFMGSDGMGWAPLGRERADEASRYLSVFYGDPPWEWSGPTVEDFLSRIRDELPVNVVLQAPHFPVRLGAMGWEARPAGDDEVARMRRAVREWMEAGAVSFATGLEYEPMSNANPGELVELAREAAGFGGLYVAYLRGYGPGSVRGALEEVAHVGRQAALPVHVSHLFLDEDTLPALEDLLALGTDLTFDAYPYTAGCTHLLYALPRWAQAGSPGTVRERLGDPEFRRAVSSGLEAALGRAGWQVSFAAVHGHPEFEGRYFAEVWEQSGRSLADFCCDLLLASDLRVLMVWRWDGEEVIQRTLQHPACLVGSDGLYVGGCPHPRGFHTFPRVLGRYVRELGVLSWEGAIHKMTGLAARRFGLSDRGVLRPGLAADVVVLDPERVAGLGSYREPRRKPVGVEFVLVNGLPVVWGGTPTGHLPGRILRRK